MSETPSAASQEAPAPVPAPPPLPQLVMRRKDLEGLPPLACPAGVTVRSMLPGDEAAWDRILGAAFGWEKPQGRFDALMRPDKPFLPERVFFALVDGVPMASASAWHRAGDPGETVGYLHYVGTQPGQVNRGLGTIVSLAALHKLRQEGRPWAMLNTDDFRIPAIFIYLRLGFRPLVTHESHRTRWPEIFRNLRGPFNAEMFAEELEGPLFRFKPAEAKAAERT